MVNFFLLFVRFFLYLFQIGANLDAQNAGNENEISGIQISKIFPDPPFMRGILATHMAFSYCYPPLIYYLTERSLFKKCPHRKILKKGPGIR